MSHNGHLNHHALNATPDTDTPPRTRPQDRLRAAYHLVLSGWEVRDAAAWLGLRPERVRSACPQASAPLKAQSIR
jgi:hypothetical protein